MWSGGALTWEEELDRRAGARWAFATRGVPAIESPGPAQRLGVPRAFLGGLKLGATVAPLNPRLTEHELAAITSDLAPALVVTALPDGDDEIHARPPAHFPALILLHVGQHGATQGLSSRTRR